MKNSRKVSSNKMGAKQITGIVMLVLSVIFFILCIFPSFLGLGRFFQGVFGVMCYPLFLLTFLVGFALSLNRSYTFNKKFTTYLVFSILGILCLLHTIFTSKILMNETTSFSKMGEYLSKCFHLTDGITVGGVLLGIVVFFFRAIIGLGATYVVFAVLATIFVGLVIDFLIYNKKQGRETKIIEKKETTTQTLIGETLADEGLYSFSDDDKQKEEYNSLLTRLTTSPNQQVETTENPEIFETTLQEQVQEETKINQTETITNRVSEQNTEERERARNLLFGTATTSQKADRIDDDNQNDEPKSAREVLFGDRNAPKVPNIFDRSPDERNDWRKQYASKTLQYNDETPQVQKDETVSQNQPEENSSNAQPEFDQGNEEGLVKTSWGSYRPTRVERESVGESDNLVPNQGQIGQQNDRLSAFGRPINQQNQNIFEQNRQENNIRQREIRDIRENRFDSAQRNTISNASQTTSENDENSVSNTEFGSRLSRTDRRLRGEDLLADASSIGISARPTNEQSFSNVLPKNPVENKEKTEIRPSRVEKISFESQLNREYKKPSTSLLKVTKEENVDYSAEYKQKSAILEATLDTFKIPAKVINVVRGPKVTRYELSMPTGIPVGRVLSYEKDMSMNLAAKNGIRIEAPIPGKNAFGVEVANDKTSMVGLRELLESPEFQSFKGPLPVAIGRNISGEVIIKSLPKMVHCLVAGSTGSGKSVFLHSLIMSLMFKHSPDELRFIMIDPKRVEFSRYNRMPHLMLPEVVTDCSKAVNALNWAVKEMERRFQLLMENECQKIDQYNALDKVRKGEEKRLPFLIIIVDELAELMGVAKKDVEGKIQRITQLGRACGIHMVVATQRPSVDVVTGVIKNNLPTRIAFSLSSYVDSKTILDEAGAEKLLGQGDMLFSGQDSNQKIRLQGAFVSDEEIKAVLDFVKENNVSEYDEEVQNSIYAEPEKEEIPDDDDDKTGNEDRMDEYMPQALKLVMKNGKASISMIQRRFSVGYARAARIIDQMETHGFINPGMGNKPREVKITIAEYNELFGDFDSEN